METQSVLLPGYTQESPAIRFIVYAKPEPQGSARAFMPKGWNRPVITSDNKDLKSYRQQLSIEAIAAVQKATLQMFPAKVPVSLTVRFYFQRPKSKSKKAYAVCRPDIDKLCRSVSDALSGICYHDDSQVTMLRAEKHYGQPERTEIEVSLAGVQ